MLKCGSSTTLIFLLKICSFSFPFKKLVPFIIEVPLIPEIIWLRIDLATLGSKITGNLPVGALVDPILSKTFLATLLAINFGSSISL